MTDPIVIRELERGDLQRGFPEVMAVLTTVDISPEKAQAIFDRRANNHRTFVAVSGNRVIGTATMIVEQKFIRSGGLTGHIEDVAVAQEAQGRDVGTMLIQRAIDFARELGCYKVVLHCSEDVSRFYAKLGFQRWAVGMRIDLPAK